MTDLSHLESVIEAAWEDRADVSAATHGDVRDAVETALALLDSGQARVASRGEDGVWTTHQWLKKAVLLSFRLNDNQIMRAGDRGPTSHAPGVGPYWDKVPNKFGDWAAGDYQAAGFRSVPGAIVRQGAYIARNVVLMPSFVNIGAYVDEGAMVDAWATVGSCAQIGKNVHLSGGAGIGGARRRGPGHGRLSVGLDQDRRPRHGRGLPGRGSGLFGRGAGHLAGSQGRPVAVLRRHRQASGRPDPGQDRGQRTAARLIAHENGGDRAAASVLYPADRIRRRTSSRPC